MANESETPEEKPTAKPIAGKPLSVAPKSAPAPKFKGYRTHCALGNWGVNTVITGKQLVGANVDEDRANQLIEAGALSEVWE